MWEFILSKKSDLTDIKTICNFNLRKRDHRTRQVKFYSNTCIHFHYKSNFYYN